MIHAVQLFLQLRDDEPKLHAMQLFVKQLDDIPVLNPVQQLGQL